MVTPEMVVVFVAVTEEMVIVVEPSLLSVFVSVLMVPLGSVDVVWSPMVVGAVVVVVPSEPEGVSVS